MPETPSIPVPPAGLPETWALDRDLPCPTCTYNLRMLRIPRCPECGLVFRWQTLLRVFCPRCGEALFDTDTDQCPRCKLHLDWALLLNQAPDEARKLFEYTNRPARAALAAWAAALRPLRFWRQIPLEAPPVVRRLRGLRRLAVTLALAGVIALLALASTAGTPNVPVAITLAASIGTLPLVTAVALPMFTPTLARFRIRRDQLLRCSAYGTSGLFWIGLYLVVASVFGWLANVYYALENYGLWFDRYSRGHYRFQPDLLLRAIGGRMDYAWRDPRRAAFTFAIALVIAALGYVWWWIFLYVSLRRYLRLDRRNAVALFLSTQIIALLVLAILVFQLTNLALAWGIV